MADHSSTAYRIAAWIYLILMLSTMWALIPAHRKLSLKHSLSAASRPRLAQAARLCGQIGMRGELAGDEPTAHLWYTSAYKLMIRVYGRIG